MKKRVLSLILCFCILLGIMPTTAFAAATGTITVREQGSEKLIAGANIEIKYQGGGQWKTHSTVTTNSLGVATYNDYIAYERELQAVVSATGYETKTSNTFTGVTSRFI